MSQIKKYKVTYDHQIDMIVEIDHSIMTDEKLHEINNFWGDSSYRFAESNRNITETVLKMLAKEAFAETIKSWDPIKAIEVAEGWPASMDGSFGIKIIKIDEVVFETDDLEVEIL